MQWEDLPASQNFEDRTGDPYPWWMHIGMERSPQDVFGRMIESLRNPLTPPINGPRGSSPEGWDQRMLPSENPGPLEIGLGLYDIGGGKWGSSSPRANPMAELLVAPHAQAPIFPRDMLAQLLRSQINGNLR